MGDVDPVEEKANGIIATVSALVPAAVALYRLLSPLFGKKKKKTPPSGG